MDKRLSQKLFCPVLLFAAFVNLSSFGLAADCNGNGVEDSEDIAGTVSEDCNANGLPDECEVVPVSISLGDDVFVVAESPQDVAVGDLDGDGDEDFVAGSRGNSVSTLKLFLNQGERQFTPGSEYLVEAELRDMFVGDLNGDDLPDVAVVFSSIATTQNKFVAIFINQGNASLAPPVMYDQPFRALSLTVSDVDGDDSLDLLTPDWAQGSITVRRNNGDGTFGSPETVEVGRDPRGIATGDLDGDGDLDIATTNSSSVDVTAVLNNGDGTFSAPVSYGVSRSPRDIKLVDLNGDSAVDVAFVAGRSFGVLFNLDDGSGSLSDPVVFMTDGNVKSIEPFDVDVDADIDLVVVKTGSATIRVNDGEGRFDLMLPLASESNRQPPPVATSTAMATGTSLRPIHNLTLSSFFGQVTRCCGSPLNARTTS